MDWSQSRGYDHNPAYLKFDIARKPKQEIVTLTETKLMQIQGLDLSVQSRLERVRDLFLFGCFTGQRWSDFSTFR